MHKMRSKHWCHLKELRARMAALANKEMPKSIIIVAQNVNQEVKVTVSLRKIPIR